MTSRVQGTQSALAERLGCRPRNATFFEPNRLASGVKTSCEPSRRSSEARFVVFEE